MEVLVPTTKLYIYGDNNQVSASSMTIHIYLYLWNYT